MGFVLELAIFGTTVVDFSYNRQIFLLHIIHGELPVTAAMMILLQPSLIFDTIGKCFCYFHSWRVGNHGDDHGVLAASAVVFCYDRHVHLLHPFNGATGGHFCSWKLMTARAGVGVKTGGSRVGGPELCV